MFSNYVPQRIKKKTKNPQNYPDKIAENCVHHSKCLWNAILGREAVTPQKGFSVYT